MLIPLRVTIPNDNMVTVPSPLGPSASSEVPHRDRRSKSACRHTIVGANSAKALFEFSPGGFQRMSEQRLSPVETLTAGRGDDAMTRVPYAATVEDRVVSLWRWHHPDGDWLD